MCFKGEGEKGFWMALVGALILVNVYVLAWDWWTFAGVLLVVLGVIKLIAPPRKVAAPAKPGRRR